MGRQRRGGGRMVVVLLVGLGLVVWVWRGVGEKQAVEEVPKGPVVRPEVKPAEVRPGDAILKGYGKDSGTVQGDLTAMAEVLGNFALLVKGNDPLPLGANEEVAAALRGKNRGRLEFISGDSSAMNEHGQLVDRWGTALFFHAGSSDRLEIRSAGPDRIMWTEDDVHRLHDGRYLRGEALEAPSLLEAGTQRRGGSGGAEKRE